MEQMIEELIEEVKYELFHYPVTTKKQDIKYLVKRLLKPTDTPKRDTFFWPHAMLTQALEEAEDIDTLKKYYDAWIGKGLLIYNLDNIMNGYSLLYVYEKTQEEKYKQAADTLYAWMCEYVKHMGNPLPYRKHHPTHVYVDALGMVVPFLCRYGRMFHNQEAMELGVKQLTEFLKYGMDEATGLPYHGYDTKTKIKYGIIGWGRAVGWLMLAMSDSFEFLPEKQEKEEILSAYQNLVEKVVSYIRADGSFSWQLSALEGPQDTSATAMIGYAVKKTGLGEQYTFQLEQIQQALGISYKDGKIYDCSGECEGFSQYPQVYGAYPWSLGPGVRFLLDK